MIRCHGQISPACKLHHGGLCPACKLHHGGICPGKRHLYFFSLFSQRWTLPAMQISPWWDFPGQTSPVLFLITVEFACRANFTSQFLTGAAILIVILLKSHSMSPPTIIPHFKNDSRIFDVDLEFCFLTLTSPTTATQKHCSKFSCP